MNKKFWKINFIICLIAISCCWYLFYEDRLRIKSRDFAVNQISSVDSINLNNATIVSNASNMEASSVLFTHSRFQHKNVISTIFWVGEGQTEDNGFIQNESSAWDDQWMKHFGGVDDPKNRQGYYTAEFSPKENPFYVALPYNDFEDGFKKIKSKLIPWAGDEERSKGKSLCKNRWLKIMKSGKMAYAQWEDVGPFLSDDFDYVFGEASPRNTFKSRAGIDVSPAVATYLGLSDVDVVDWRFVDAAEVPNGPWLEVVTTSQINWE